MIAPLSGIVFGGSFDPPHFGHAALVQSVLEQKLTERVILVPAAVSPFKQDRPPIDPKHRMALLELLLKEIPGASRNQTTIWEGELERPPPSYTIDTLKELSNTYRAPGLLIGSDSLEDIEGWERVEEIFAHYPVFVYPRYDLDRSSLDSRLHELRQAYATQGPVFQIVEAPRNECRSTTLRSMLQRDAISQTVKEELATCLLPSMLAYIQNHGLYA